MSWKRCCAPHETIESLCQYKNLWVNSLDFPNITNHMLLLVCLRHFYVILADFPNLPKLSIKRKTTLQIPKLTNQSF